MRLILGFIRAILTLVFGAIFFVVAAVVVLVGAAALLVFGRRAAGFRIYTGRPQSFTPPDFGFEPRPPMRDVTPRKLETASEQ